MVMMRSSLELAAIQRLALIRLEDEYYESRTKGKPDNEDVNIVIEKLNQVPGYVPSKYIQQAWSAMVSSAREALPKGEPITPDWVISTACEVSEDGDDTDQMLECPRGRRRIRLYDLFEIFIDLCGRNLDEITVGGWDREHFVQHELQEWELCANRVACPLQEPWLQDQELYGEVVRAY